MNRSLSFANLLTDAIGPFFFIVGCLMAFGFLVRAILVACSDRAGKMAGAGVAALWRLFAVAPVAYATARMRSRVSDDLPAPWFLRFRCAGGAGDHLWQRKRLWSCRLGRFLKIIAAKTNRSAKIENLCCCCCAAILRDDHGAAPVVSPQ